MHLHIIILLGLGMSMDAFAVSITNGLVQHSRGKLGCAFKCAAAFGAAQAIMPVIGFFVGYSFSGYIRSLDHWVALILLGFLGIRMIKDARVGGTDRSPRRDLPFHLLLVQAVATSIDALALGVTLSFLPVDIFFSAMVIGVCTAICCFCGVFIGARFGAALKNKAEILGGIILIGIGLHIFLEHTLFY